MTTRNAIFGVLGLALIALIALAPIRQAWGQQKTTAAHWEYKIVDGSIPSASASRPANQELLNQLGGEGWELVTLSQGGWYYFKRLKHG